MIWKSVAVGCCLALGLLPPTTALANAPVTAPRPSPMAALPELPTETEHSPTEQPSTGPTPTEHSPTESAPTEPAPTAAPLPWAEILEGNPQQPLRVGEYNRIMDTLWTHLNDQRTLRSNRIQAACDALGSDMRYLRGRVPRQIEDAHRQMAPFQPKGLAAESTLDSLDPGAKFSYRLADAMGVEGYAEAAAILEILRSEDDPYLYYETYRQLFSQFLNLNLDDYLDPAQDEVPLSRSEFVGYVETLYQEWQDPTGSLAQHERFLAESDRLIQDLLTMLREVRQSLAMLEATKAHTHLSPPETPKQTLAPLPLSAPQAAPPIGYITAPTLGLDEDAFVTRRDFLLAMLDLLSPLEFALFQYIPWCGSYRVDVGDNPAYEMWWEVEGLIRDLDILNVEILELVRAHSR